MEETDKTLLRRYRINLVTQLDPLILYDVLLEKGIFTQDMIEKIMRPGSRRDQARLLLLDLETRGSRAFPLFLECLQETGQHTLLNLLRNGAPDVQTQPVRSTQAARPVVHPLLVSSGTSLPVDVGADRKYDDLVSPGHRSDLTPTPSSEKEDIVAGTQSKSPKDFPCYKMDSSPCGLCLIINNTDFEPQSNLSRRNGSNVDCDKMERRFRALNFIVKVKANLRQRQIKHELSTLSKTDHSQYDCCVVIMLSHGTEVSHNRFPGAVYGVDGENVPVQHITNYLNGQHCPSLLGKPKLFFIQACGGDERDTGSEASPDEFEPSVRGAGDQTDAIPTSSSSDSLSMSDEPDARVTLPTPGDILVSYSTFPGYVSWRDTQSGSWYVETLDRVLKDNADACDLGTILMIVNHEVSQNSAKGLYKQIPGSFNFLRKHLYFQTQGKRQTSP
ncbi:caspase-9 [Brachionichthys hirsutus]|uniref:caspase-9 n=1 Tax=Brachionichthys hirsutus TaxID=412623 RepID=UPI0036052C61